MLGTSSSQEKFGLTRFGYERCLAHAHIAFVALEFGTYQPPRGGRVLQADHWQWNHGDPTGPEAVPLRDALRDPFYPPFDDWKEMVLWRSRQVPGQGVTGLAGDDVQLALAGFCNDESSMNFYRAIRKGTIFKAIVGREPFHWVSARPEVLELGSKYGGWGIDASAISSSTTVASFGLGEDVTFEASLIERFGCQVYGFDPTPRSVRYVTEHVRNPRFSAFPYALSDTDGTLTFTLPPASAADQVSASAVARYDPSSAGTVDVPSLTLATARSRFGLQRLDIVKMDIEGAEYAVIQQAVTNGWLDEVGQVLVEFHHFLPGLTSAQTRQAIALLRGAGFDIAWIGRTNHEYLFTRQRRNAAR